MKSRYDKGPEGVDQSEVWTKVERSDVTLPWTAGLAGLVNLDTVEPRIYLHH